MKLRLTREEIEALLAAVEHCEGSLRSQTTKGALAAAEIKLQVASSRPEKSRKKGKDG